MIPAKKSLGQNFLKSKEALRAMIAAGDIAPTDTVLEVGPGKGVLTRELLKVAAKVISVEKDSRLIESLKKEFEKEIAELKLVILEKDILEYEPAGKYKIIANIPYYITGSFLQKFLESENQPEKIVVMLQKEVAKRITVGAWRGDSRIERSETEGDTRQSAAGKESILSISVKAYGHPRYIMTVKAKYFSPEPNVDSAIIAIENISKKFFQGFTEEQFFKLVKAGFAHKRKMLAGNLSEAAGTDGAPFAPPQNSPAQKSHRSAGSLLLESAGIPEKARAENLSLQDWKKLIAARS